MGLITVCYFLRLSIIDECFSKDTVVDIIKSFVSSCTLHPPPSPLQFRNFSQNPLANYDHNECEMYDIPLQGLEASKDGNGWIGAILKGLKRSSPTGLKITLRSVITQYMIRNRYHAWKQAASYYIEFEFIRNNSPWRTTCLSDS
jgi:hypothetical protein